MSGLILVTGASSGIGEAISRKLHASGGRVLLTGRSEQRLHKIESELKGSTAFVCDLEKPADVERLAAFVEGKLSQQHLSLKGLVNNAGIFQRQSFNETSDADWLRQFQVNLFAAVTLTRRLYPLLKDAGNSSVLNISSTLGLRSVSNTSAYSASKAAMISWTKTLALEWASDGIRVNCVCPGLVDTPIHPFHGRPDSDEGRKMAHALQPLRRMGKPEDIAEASEFLLSERSSWTTGTILTVDGGIHLA